MSDWNAKVISEFRANGGKVAQFGDRPLVILHTIGARSGQVREIPLVALPDGERFVVFASKAGAPTNPDWYHNLKANPEITVEHGSGSLTMRATELDDPERQRYFDQQVSLIPFFGEYQKKASPRIIPAFALDPV